MPWKGTTEKTATELASDFITWRDSKEMVFRCAYCKRFKFVGTREEGMEKYAAHRAEKHPNKVAVGKPRLTSAQQRQRALERSEWRREAARAEL